jgi:Mrp family chromosome partitioning ATPase
VPAGDGGGADVVLIDMPPITTSAIKVVARMNAINLFFEKI